MWRKIRKQGFTGERTLVGKWIRQNYDTKNVIGALTSKKTEIAVPCSRELAWLIIRHSDDLDEDEKQLIEVLLHDDKLAELRQLAHQRVLGMPAPT